jgi:hypothetical protein
LQSTHGLKFSGTRFWVTHRRRDFGPFDYEWNKDFLGIELLYRGEKFGEYCSSEELFADLKPFELPMRVVEVASIAMGCILFGMLSGFGEFEREQLLLGRLRTLGYGQFAHIDRCDEAAR